MAWSSPRTWVTNEVVTAAHMNQEVRDNLDAAAPNGVTAVDWDPPLKASTTDPTVATVDGAEGQALFLHFGWVRWTIPFSTGGEGGNGTYFVTLPSTVVGIEASGTGTVIGTWRAATIGGPSSSNEVGALFLGSATTAEFGRHGGSILSSTATATGFGSGGLILSCQFVYPFA